MNEYNEIAEILKALGHPVRLKMVRGLMQNSCNVNKIVNALKLPQSTVSQHLRVLKSAGIVKGQRKGVKICYCVEHPLVKKIIELL
jgi:DNA-binding transcriptional ArsR family regulator